MPDNDASMHDSSQANHRQGNDEVTQAESSPSPSQREPDLLPQPKPVQQIMRPVRYGWRKLKRSWRGLSRDQVTPVRLGSHLALLLMALLAVGLSRIDLPRWEIVQLAAPRASEVSPRPELVFRRQSTGGSPLQESGVLLRAPVPFTEIPDRPRSSVITYTVQIDDTVLGIAEQFKLNPNSVLWANLEDLNNPFVMEVGQVLLIPPVDGVLHTVEEGDTLEKIAKRYGSSVEKIAGYEPNQLATGDALLTPGQVVIVPDGDKTPPEQQVAGPGPRGGAGLSAPYRAQGFIWPTYGILTQRYWLPAHPAIDIGADIGTPVVAADEGSVSSAGWSSVGYGNYVIIYHADGFATLYAHLSRIDIDSGDYVNRGQQIGAVGSTGRSTGPHLHFEVSLGGRTYNPLTYLP